MKFKQLRGSMLLILTAFIWGIAFVAQSVGMSFVGPYTFTCSRSIIGGLVLLPCIMILNKLGFGEASKETSGKESKKELVIGGVCCGILLCAGTCFQQIGIMYTTVGKAGFITAFYIIIVPILGLFLKRKCGLAVWCSVVIALIGLYFLCMTESLTIQLGDILLFICALIFSLHIICVDHFSSKVNGVKLSCIQFWVTALISGVMMFLFEQPEWTFIIAAWQPILYAGILSSGVGYTLQIIGQRDVKPTVASLIMSLESVFSVLAGFVLLGQRLSGRELLGCLLMFVAIILAQLPQKEK